MKRTLPLLVILATVALLTQMNRGPTVEESVQLVVAANQKLEDELTRLKEAGRNPKVIQDPSQFLEVVLESRARLQSEAEALRGAELASEVEHLRELCLGRLEAFDETAQICEEVLPAYQDLQAGEMDSERLREMSEKMKSVGERAQELYKQLLNLGEEFKAEKGRLLSEPSPAASGNAGAGSGA